MKKLMVVVMLVILALVGCERDRTPLMPVEVAQPEWRALFIRGVQYQSEYAVIEVWDGIQHEFLKEIRCVDPDANEIFSPVSWEYYYTRKDAHVYLVVLTLEDWERQPRFEGR